MYHLLKSLYLRATSLPEYSILVLGLDGAGKTTFLNQVRNMYGSAAITGDRLAIGSSGDGPPSESAGRTVPTVGQNVVTVSKIIPCMFAHTLPACQYANSLVLCTYDLLLIATQIQLPSLYLRIWDIGGQQSLRSLWRQYYASCHAIVFLVDSSDVGDGNVSFLSLRSPLESGSSPKRKSGIYEHSTNHNGRLGECAEVLTEVLKDGGTAGVPLLVLANKQDREDSIEVVRIKEGFVRKVVEGEDVIRMQASAEEHGYPRDGEDVHHGTRGQSYVRDSRVLPSSAMTGQGVKEAIEWVSTRAAWNMEARPPVMR